MTDIVLIAGLWLPSEVWGEVQQHLEQLGHRSLAVELPGQDDGDAGSDLSDQVSAVLATVDAADDPLVVGHSAAATLAWIAADRRKLRGVALIGGFPAADGDQYASFLPAIGGSIPFPGWEAFEGPDSADLSAEARKQLSAQLVPVPDGVAQGVVRLTDQNRYETPVTLICPEFSPEDARAWIAGGDVPELAKATKLSLVDIDSGHWPMITRPEQLANLLAAAAAS